MSALPAPMRSAPIICNPARGKAHEASPPIIKTAVRNFIVVSPVEFRHRFGAGFLFLFEHFACSVFVGPEMDEELRGFFLDYAAAFEARDVAAITALYAYPAHVTSDVGDSVALIAIMGPEQFKGPLESLLEMYRRVGCKKIRLAELNVEQLSGRMRRATVRWGLVGLADLPLYDFATSYVLARFDGKWRITSAVSHDEMARYRHFIGR
jgi:hypothetical protein